MKRINTIKNSDEFGRILKSIRPKRGKYFSIYYEKTNIDTYKIGLVCSKKNGKANKRNKIKRKVKNILSKVNITESANIIILINKKAMEEKYDILEKELIYLLNQVIKEK